MCRARARKSAAARESAVLTASSVGIETPARSEPANPATTKLTIAWMVLSEALNAIAVSSLICAKCAP